MHNKSITLKNFITNYISITCNFYGQPKTHKSKQIKSAVETQKSEYIEIPKPSDLKFRPIVEGPSCMTIRLCKLIGILLQPFLNKILKSYIGKRTKIFKTFSQKKMYPQTLIVTSDVTNL